MKLFRVFVLIFIFILVGCSNNSSNNHPSNEELYIFTSIYPIQYVVKQIAGNEAIVESIYPPGVDAHTYEPTSREITTIAEADAFFYLGAGMEGFAESATEALQSQDVLFVEIGANKDLFIAESHNHEHDHHHDNHDHGDFDPHIWLDPLRMIEVGAIVRDKLIELQPDHEEIFNENFTTLEENMLELDGSFETTLEAKEKKQIIVTHAAYGYWKERYGIEQISISGISSTDEPSQQQLIEIAKRAQEENLTYVIFEKNSSNRIATIIQKYIEAEKVFIHNLETLTDQEVENEENYLSIMQENLEVLNKVTD